MGGATNLRYKCIVIDHDDTTINSTPLIHYQSYVNYMKKENCILE